MTDPAAIAGSFSDAKLIKSRSIMQIIVEVPIEQADAALRALGGVPQPGAEKAVAVALLNPNLKGGDAPSRAQAPLSPGLTAPYNDAPVAERKPAAGARPTPSGPLAAGVPRATADAPIPPEQTPKAPDKQRIPGAASSQDRVVQRCAILCGDRRFQRWLWKQRGGGDQGFNAMNMAQADEWTVSMVRRICDVTSRKDLAIDNDARRRWDALLLAYEQANGLAPVDHRRTA